MHRRSWVVTLALVAMAVLGALPTQAAYPASAGHPSITAISPLAGRPAGGDRLTIRGASLTGVTAVSFGGARSRQVTHLSAGLLSVVVPAHRVGAVAVRLLTHGVAGADAATYRYAAPPTQLRWSPDRAIDPDRGDLYGLSCPSRNFCASVDGSDTAPALLTFAPGHRPHRSPLPAHGAVPNVSCTSASRCFAMTDGTVSRWDGTRWSRFVRVAPHRAWVEQLSCVVGTRFCLAIGTTGATYVHRPRGWIRAARVRGGVAQPALSCVSAHFCMLTDGAHAYRFDGARWHAASAGLPSYLQYDTGKVACAAPDFCLLVAQYDALRWTGTTWQSTEPALADYGGSLACPSVRLCVYAGGGSGVSEWRAGRWHAATVPGQAATLPAISCPDSRECLMTIRSGVAVRGPSGWSARYIERSGGDLSDISCVAVAWCMAVDGHGNAIRRAAGTWRRPRPVDARRAVSAVSCASRDFCVAVDGADPYDRYTRPGVGRAVVLRGGRWHAPAVIDRAHGLTDVACASAKLCFAVDDAGYALRWNGRRWSAPRRVGAVLEAVACPTPSHCLAVGRRSAEWRAGRWRAMANPAVAKQLTDIACPDAHYCAVGGDGGFYVRHAGTWSDAIEHGRNLWQVQVACLSRAACFGSQDNQADVWDYAFDGSRSAFSAQQLYGPKMSCVPGACFAVSLDFVNVGRPAARHG